MDGTPPPLAHAALAPASRAELVAALAYALRFDTRGKAHRQATELTARIAPETIAAVLDQSGFVVLKHPPSSAPRTLGGADRGTAT